MIALRAAAEEKKRAVFQQLKSQMETDLRRRASEREIEAIEDTERMQEALKRDNILSQVDENLKDQAK